MASESSVTEMAGESEVAAVPEPSLENGLCEAREQLAEHDMSQSLPQSECFLPGSQLQGHHVLPSIFGEVCESNVTFCIDTSGSMYSSLDAVKNQLIEALMQQAHSQRSDFTFNLIEFNSEVTQWSDKMVKCTPQTVAVAAQWIQKLEAKTETNTLDALLTAFSDRTCQAVYLITDGVPDQHPSDVLDHISYAAQNRPIHCYYIQGGNPDSRATEFLNELALDSYGSFHVISVAQHGAIERITPVYRAEAAAERIVRTTDGSVYPSNHRICSVATTLNNPPEIAVDNSIVIANPYMYPPLYPYYLYPWPYRYYYRNLPHNTGWSRFRPAKGWSKNTDGLLEGATGSDFAPGPGAMLIGIKVLARRNEDGFFYQGTVKSQLLSDKFLVEFGPCKHGRFTQTAYQETFVHDIISHDDALRHAVICGDKVLAPWEPEGEKYGPGIVIEGQEKRQATGGGHDQEVVVSFFNGKTSNIPQDMAVWIPQALHERITFELRLPQQVRQEFSEQETYPEDNLPGYPTSGPVASPQEFEQYEPAWAARSDGVVADRGVYRPPFYVPAYPIYYKYQPKKSVIRSEDIDKIIPGTDLTKGELNEKVMCQLMEHKMLLESKADRKDRAKLLKRRGILHDNSLKKSVSFQLDSDVEGECDACDLETRDSGRGSQEEDDYEDDGLRLSDYEGIEDDMTLRAIADDMKDGEMRQLGNKSPVRRRRRRYQVRPPWKYWGNEETPSLIESNHYGPYRLGPYDPTSIPGNLELRRSKISPDGVEWATSMTEYVDSFARQRGDVGASDVLHMPHPPNYKPAKQGPGRDISDILGMPLSEQEQRAEARKENRRLQVLHREYNQVVTEQGKEQMKLAMEDQNRARTLDQINRQNQRQMEEWQKVDRQREAKKQINAEIRSRIESNQQREQQKDEQRVEAMRRGRQRRDDIVAQHNQQIEQMKEQAQVRREQKVKEQQESVSVRAAEQDAQQVCRDVAARRAKIQRIQHFRQLEADGQKQKVLHGQVADQQRALQRSYVLP